MKRTYSPFTLIHPTVMLLLIATFQMKASSGETVGRFLESRVLTENWEHSPKSGEIWEYVEFAKGPNSSGNGLILTVANRRWISSGGRLPSGMLLTPADKLRLETLQDQVLVHVYSSEPVIERRVFDEKVAGFEKQIADLQAKLQKVQKEVLDYHKRLNVQQIQELNLQLVEKRVEEKYEERIRKLESDNLALRERLQEMEQRTP